MDVSVPHIPGSTGLRRKLRLSLAGDSFLERARSTTFALLGMIAAVGLVMVSLALHQEWPVLGGSPIPHGATESGAVHIARGVALADLGEPSPSRAIGPGFVASKGGGGAKENGSSNRGAQPEQGVTESDPLGSEPSPQPAPAEPEPVAPPVAEQPVESPPPATSPASSPVRTAASAVNKVVSAVGNPEGSGSGGSRGKSTTTGHGGERSTSPASPAPLGDYGGSASHGSSGSTPSEGSGNSESGREQDSGSDHGSPSEHGHSGH